MDDRTFTSQVAERLGCDERRATDVIFAVFQELRDRLTPEEADDVAAQLPTPLKRLWQVGERPGREVRRTHKPEFVAGCVRRSASPTTPRRNARCAPSSPCSSGSSAAGRAKRVRPGTC